MWIQVRTFDGKKTVKVKGLSKLTKVEELRESIKDKFDAEPSQQQLFYRGKLLVNGHTLFDYNVGLNDLIQLMIRQKIPVAPVQKDEPKPIEYESEENSNSSDKENKMPESCLPAAKASTSGQLSGETEDISDSIYKIGDIIDGRDPTMGAWFEAKIVKIIPKVCTNARKGNDSTATPLQEVVNSDNKNECSRDRVEGCVNDIGRTDTENRLDTRISNEECNASTGLSHENADKNKQIHSNSTDSKLSEKGTIVDENANHCDSLPVMDTQTDSKFSDAQWKEKLLKDIPKTNDGFIYSIVFDGYEEDEPVELDSNQIRPRARHIIKFKDITVGQKVMANYNYDSPEQRGYWYDCIVTSKRDTRTIKELYGTAFIGVDLTPLENCHLLFRDEIFTIESAGMQMNESHLLTNPEASPAKRLNKPECDYCNDNPRRKCRHCACSVCGGKNNPEKQILCDECDMAYHLDCLKPPLEKIPDEDEWYCPECKVDDGTVVKAGERLKESKKRAKMPSAKNTSTRDWGKGMACVGRQKECTLVPPDHFGVIPGVPVGTTWKFRVQVSEAGIHRPHVAGIHGREDVGAFSIVLSGGYEDDVDNGDDFTYTGSGGRDLSGNKRTAEQSCDQTLTRYNKALARNCNAPLDDKKGTEAKDWRAGKPVRVVRSCKGRKHSKYAPLEGNRYDGIYKIVKYWPAKGKSGFLVWRYFLRRDDTQSAPWTNSGKKRIKELGLAMQYPDGYLEAQNHKEEKDKKKKRNSSGESTEASSKKKQKVAAYKVDPAVSKLCKEDSANSKLWKEVMQSTKEGATVFFSKVEELFICVCCQELVFNPITTDCCHNVCKSCLQRSFKAEIYTCPSCRAELGKGYSMNINKTLSKILSQLYPGYGAGRS
ncbi:E3 ubiquitin-protein ligase UHRF1-like [Octopus vulgaris]|uniref:RING-type E3 ubiquitin transferase n=2 Tax=Octopus vulgaris TaxID=6645 RepID=A0AA36B468_OCTVU|nr:E3 ubiquitin-protein ligase UHRF1-like [Octopus vulgaris]